MSRLVVVSNRVGPMEEADARAGGLAVALRDALKRSGGVWFGWSGQVDAAPPEQPQVAVRGRVSYATVDLGPEDYEDYYKGFANGSLWPLFHYRLGLFEYSRREYAGYLRVNADFARKLGPLLRPDDIVWVHDYHLIPLGAELRRAGHTNRIGIFLHTPLPTTEVMIALPCHDGLMRALCAYDLVGVQTKADLRAFTNYVENEANGRVSPDGGGGECVVQAYGQTLRAGAFPISIDTETFAATAADAAGAEHTLRLKRSLVDRHLIIGVDRLDYSKGLVQRFDSIAQLLTAWPEHRARVTFLQIAPPSRGDIAQYQDLRNRLERAAGHINGRFAEFDWMPIRYLNRSFSRRTLSGFLRAARIGLVTPLRDGMNLVAKEYIAAQDPADPGVLVLSRFAGAAQELDGALIVNPYDVEEVAEALHQGLTMSLDERRDRWQRQFDVVRRNGVREWRDRFLHALRTTPRVLAATAG